MLGRCGAGAELGGVDDGVVPGARVVGGVDGVDGGGVAGGVVGVGVVGVVGVGVVGVVGVGVVGRAAGGAVGADGELVGEDGGGDAGDGVAGGVEVGGGAGREPPLGAVVVWPRGCAQFEHQRASARFAVPQDGQRTGRSSVVPGRFVSSLGSLIGRGGSRVEGASFHLSDSSGL